MLLDIVREVLEAECGRNNIACVTLLSSWAALEKGDGNTFVQIFHSTINDNQCICCQLGEEGQTLWAVIFNIEICQGRDGRETKTSAPFFLSSSPCLELGDY